MLCEANKCLRRKVRPLPSRYIYVGCMFFLILSIYYKETSIILVLSLISHSLSQRHIWRTSWLFKSTAYIFPQRKKLDIYLYIARSDPSTHVVYKLLQYMCHTVIVDKMSAPKWTSLHTTSMMLLILVRLLMRNTVA